MPTCRPTRCSCRSTASAGSSARLVESLRRLDYPAAKLDVRLLLEEDDEETRAALAGWPLPPHFRVVLVPPALPRTKPKALNYGLALAHGRLVCIFDAEDIPEPGQLRLAAATFAAHPDIACLQARLAMFNWRDNWLSRQFALEYAMLFDVLLPCLDRLDLPLPLGGTSNHFRAEVLEEVGGWDAFNVTEDADLGMRLRRFGHRCATLPVSTWEEAPNTLGQWLPQRTRWLKGWIQTYVVHMREPRRLRAELGPAGFLAFQLLVAGPVVSALAYPVFTALVVLHTLRGDLLLGSGWWPDLALRLLAGGNLVLFFLSVPALCLVALRRRRMPGMIFEIITSPFCWFLVSAAAYRALWQYATDPFTWEKTEHGRDRSSAPVPLKGRGSRRGCPSRHEDGGAGERAAAQPVEREVRLR